MHWDDLAAQLRSKAREDEQAMLVLRRELVPYDALLGFHAQQAVEKLLKAVLAFRRVEHPRTHDLTMLIDLLRGAGVVVPAEVEDARRLGPFAVAARYGELPGAPGPAVDREWMAATVRAVRLWVDELLAAEGGRG